MVDGISQRNRFAEVLYGPFSSQYSGNSMGGVINLNTRMPEKFEAQMDATGMFQNIHRSGRNETLTGYKTFISAGDRIDRFSVWGSYNRFENEGQPQTINAAALSTAAGGTAVTGGEGYQTTTGAPAIAYGTSALPDKRRIYSKPNSVMTLPKSCKGVLPLPMKTASVKLTTRTVY